MSYMTPSPGLERLSRDEAPRLPALLLPVQRQPPRDFVRRGPVWSHPRGFPNQHFQVAKRVLSHFAMPMPMTAGAEAPSTSGAWTELLQQNAADMLKGSDDPEALRDTLVAMVSLGASFSRRITSSHPIYMPYTYKYMPPHTYKISPCIIHNVADRIALQEPFLLKPSSSLGKFKSYIYTHRSRAATW